MLIKYRRTVNGRQKIGFIFDHQLYKLKGKEITIIKIKYLQLWEL